VDLWNISIDRCFFIGRGTGSWVQRRIQFPNILQLHLNVMRTTRTVYGANSLLQKRSAANVPQPMEQLQEHDLTSLNSAVIGSQTKC
jgi:hypothetical protein